MPTPTRALPEMTLPAPAAVPPMVLLLDEVLSWMPYRVLPRAAVPAALVPT